jgi:hypothetical protein
MVPATSSYALPIGLLSAIGALAGAASALGARWIGLGLLVAGRCGRSTVK